MELIEKEMRRLKRYESLVRMIASEPVELSWEKTINQRDFWKKEAKDLVNVDMLDRIPPRMNLSKKFKLTGETINIDGRILYRIQALKNFGSVTAGDLGGFVESEDNLCHQGKAWVYENAKVYGNAWVSENARLYGNARLSENAQIYGNAHVYGDACVTGYARVYGNAQVYGNAWISGSTKVYEDALVYGTSWVYGNTKVTKFFPLANTE